MSLFEIPLALPGRAPGQISGGTLRCFRPQSLADTVEAIWDWDIPDDDAARALTIKQMPGTALLLMAHYRTPAQSHHQGRSLPVKCATQIHKSAVSVQPIGPLGMIVVCLRADAAARIVHAPPGQFADASVYLGDVFGAGDVSVCDGLLASARSSGERLSIVESFLLRRVRPSAESMADRVAALLKRNPGLQVQKLASDMGISVRHLSRSFKATFGVGVKQFARLARIEDIVARRSKGLPWVEVACDCGMVDQAHLIKEFKEIVGQSPARFFDAAICIEPGIVRAANFIVHGSEHRQTA
jgi:AraC-like DNA-binding protein